MENNERAVTYDQVPYRSLTFRSSHPETLCVVAAMAGLDAAPAQECRVLELGCASGGNLLPMAAAYPKSQFLGIDLSARQIAEGCVTIQAAELTNVELRCQDLCRFNPEGTFDFIIAHGLYSWVPSQVRDRLLAFCGQYLSPRGVAFISYMVYPGASVHVALRHAMQMAIRDVAAEDLAMSARKAVGVLADVSLKMAPRWGPLLAHWSKDLTSSADYAILHDQLEANYHPVFLTDFVAHAAANGLRYLDDADREIWNQAALARQRLDELSSNRVEQLQFMDIAGFRMFRQSILARSDAPYAAPDPLAVIERAYIASDRLVPPANQVGTPTAPAPDPVTDGPLEQAVLRQLAQRWPKAMAYADLLRNLADAVPAGADRPLAHCLLKLFEARRIELWMHEPTFIDDGSASHHPRVSKLARVQAATGAMVANLRHVSFPALDDQTRKILTMLDGSSLPAEAVAYIPKFARQSLLLAPSV